MAGRKQKRRGENLSAKHIKKNSLFGREAMGNTVCSECLSQAERERI